MQLPQVPQAASWQAPPPARRVADLPVITRDADAFSPPTQQRRLHAAALLVALAVLATNVGLGAIDDPRPLDDQLSAAMHRATDTLRRWQAQLSRGLQVSLRAVADGRDTQPVTVAQAGTAAPDAQDGEPPTTLAPRQLQPVR